MIIPRVLPCLLMDDGGLVKTKRFTDRRYIGDPINAVKIFNTKEVDELILLNIDRARISKSLPLREIEEIVSEAFMPVGFGGGISNLEDMDKLFKIGIDKIIINSAVFENPNLVKDAIRIYGSQSIVLSIDVRKDLFGNWQVYSNSGLKKRTNLKDYLNFVREIDCGEVILTNIEREGMRTGYDIKLLEFASKQLPMPIVANGGARGEYDFIDALKVGASAVSASSIFIYQGIHDAVLISYNNKIF